MTTEDELRELIALGDKATARPWETYLQYNIGNGDRGIAACGGHNHADDDLLYDENEANCAYITAAANLAPEIAAELIAARFLVEQLRKAIESVRDVGWYSPVTPEYKAAWKKVDATLKGGDL